MAPRIPDGIAAEMISIFANFAGIPPFSALQKSVTHISDMTALFLRAMQRHIPIESQFCFV